MIVVWGPFPCSKLWIAFCQFQSLTDLMLNYFSALLNFQLYQEIFIGEKVETLCFLWCHWRHRSRFSYKYRALAHLKNAPKRISKEREEWGITKENNLWRKIESVSDIVVRWKNQKSVISFECIVVFGVLLRHTSVKSLL